MSAPTDLEDREGQPCLEDVVGHLGRMERCLEREGLLLRVLEPPFGPRAELLHASFGVERLGARDQRDVGVAAEDRLGGFVQELLWHRAADAGVEAIARLHAETFGQSADRVVVLKALAVDDLDGVDALSHGGFTGGCRGVGDRDPADLIPHGERLGGL